MNMESRLDEELKRQLLETRLPSLPAVAVQLIGLGRSTHANITQLVEIVNNDPALAVALIRMANSAAYRRIKPADSVALAASYLGFEKSRMIALSATLVPALADGGEPAFCYPRFWRRALIGGALARVIGRRLLPNDTEALFLAALVQDIGILALARLELPVYAQLHCEDFSHAKAVDSERRAIGEDHGAVGAWLLQHWGFPAHLVRAVRVSNNPSLCRATADGVDLGTAITAAGLMADAWMWTSAPPELSELESRICSLLDLSWPDVLEMLSEATAEIPLVEALCSVRVTDHTSMQMALSVLRGKPQLHSVSG